MSNRPTESRRILALLAAAGLLIAAGCGREAREDSPAVDAGLAGLLDEPVAADLGQQEEPAEEFPADLPVASADLESMIAEQAAELSAAWNIDTPTAEDEPDAGAAPDVSLEAMLGSDDASETETAEAETPEEPKPLGLDDLYAQLDQALGQELATTSEPFRVAVVSIALASAQGRDPASAVAEGTAAGDALSPDERESALAIAGLLGSLLAGESESSDRAAVLRQFGEQLGKTVGLQIPTALLCTRVRGFGKYEPFSTNSFLAGRAIRALVYVEVDQFEHGVVDSAGLGGASVEEQWSIDLSQSLELYHEGESAMLAWRRPAEIVVETSRNKQRDFYLLTEIDLPQTLTIGSYQLKVIVKDRVGDQQAEAFIPIKIVADPALAWTPGG